MALKCYVKSSRKNQELILLSAAMQSICFQTAMDTTIEAVHSKVMGIAEYRHEERMMRAQNYRR
jgi:hypothetical protein